MSVDAKATLAQYALRLRAIRWGPLVVDRQVYISEAAVLESLGWVECTPRSLEGRVVYEVTLTPQGLQELRGMQTDASS